jgi:bifunctional non-homologous end joining protein LigD
MGKTHSSDTAMLEKYKSKRDFERTREPSTGQPAEGSLRFVVQKHAARRLHYDFRLEMDGVLKSWSVPKGPSLDPDYKRLAVMVEDHPLDYATFEGVIAHGNYGAGQVIVWDAGTYSPDEDGRLSFGDRDEAEEKMMAGLEAGKLSFALRGRTLRGSWTLVKTTRSPNDWLLIKHRDRYADPEHDVLIEDRSVQSGLTIDELKEGRLPEPGATVTSVADAARALGEEAAFPSQTKPMLARLVDAPFSGRSPSSVEDR